MNSADLVARMRDGICVKAWLHHDNLSPDLPATVELLSEAADRIVALEAWKAEAMEVLRTFAEDGELFGHPDKYQIAARRLVEKEDGA